MSAHTCHATNCTTPVPPRMLMCARHWRMVPKPLQDDVWATYRPGQERTKDPSLEYLNAAFTAIEAVAIREARLSGALPVDETHQGDEMSNRDELVNDIAAAINRNNAESGSDTPDFILAEFAVASIEAFDAAVRSRDDWYGVQLSPGGVDLHIHS
jgi:hypothetical protein